MNPGEAMLYTGLAYAVTVAILIAPYLVFSDLYVCLGSMLAGALLIIAFFKFHIAVAKNLSFGRRFAEMAGISIGIAALTFCIGLLVRRLLPVDL